MTPDDLRTVLQLAPPSAPIHIHVAEQRPGPPEVAIGFGCHEQGQCEPPARARCEDRAGIGLRGLDPVQRLLIHLRGFMVQAFRQR